MSMVQDIIQIKIKQTTWADKSLPFLPGNNLNLLGHHLESVQQLPQHSRLNVSLVRPLLSEENQSYQHSPSTSHTWDQTMSWSTPKMGMPKVRLCKQFIILTITTTSTSIRTECALPEEHVTMYSTTGKPREALVASATCKWRSRRSSSIPESNTKPT